jgi:oxygen-independent coproporphyrinogen-3 oxidase
MSVRPAATPAPAVLPQLAVTPGTAFGIYVHVPFCATRCGYCDFNTYTAGELGGATPDGWLAALRRSWRWPSLRSAPAGRHRVRRRWHTVAARWFRPRRGARRRSGQLRADARRGGDHGGQPRIDVAEFFDEIGAAGYTRVSLGMQSAAPGVLAVLDRTIPRGGRCRRRARRWPPGSPTSTST